MVKAMYFMKCAICFLSYHLFANISFNKSHIFLINDLSDDNCMHFFFYFAQFLGIFYIFLKTFGWYILQPSTQIGEISR